MSSIVCEILWLNGLTNWFGTRCFAGTWLFVVKRLLWFSLIWRSEKILANKTKMIQRQRPEQKSMMWLIQGVIRIFNSCLMLSQCGQNVQDERRWEKKVCAWNHSQNSRHIIILLIYILGHATHTIWRVELHLIGYNRSCSAKMDRFLCLCSFFALNIHTLHCACAFLAIRQTVFFNQMRFPLIISEMTGCTECHWI